MKKQNEDMFILLKENKTIVVKINSYQGECVSCFLALAVNLIKLQGVWIHVNCI